MRRRFTGLWLVVSIGLTIVGSQASAAFAHRAAAGPTQKVAGRFVAVQQTTGSGSSAGCAHSVGVLFKAVPKALSYSISYWDGYYKKLESTGVSGQFTQNPLVPKGDVYASITGGNYAGPCTTPDGDNAELRSRFDKSPSVVANLPAPPWSAAKCLATYHTEELQRGILWNQPGFHPNPGQAAMQRELKASLQVDGCKLT